jgi:hypothetical protein
MTINSRVRKENTMDEEYNVTDNYEVSNPIYAFAHSTELNLSTSPYSLKDRKVNLFPTLSNAIINKFAAMIINKIDIHKSVLEELPSEDKNGCKTAVKALKKVETLLKFRQDREIRNIPIYRNANESQKLANNILRKVGKRFLEKGLVARYTEDE